MINPLLSLRDRLEQLRLRDEFELALQSGDERHAVQVLLFSDCSMQEARQLVDTLIAQPDQWRFRVPAKERTPAAPARAPAKRVTMLAARPQEEAVPAEPSATSTC